MSNSEPRTKKAKKTGQCKLCLEPGVALCESHIIPEFNYKWCYDEKHRMLQISSSGPKHEHYPQTGQWEHLLCSFCERKISVWETYTKGIIHDDGLHLINRQKHCLTIGGADYARLKLYGMSLLWRMGVSRRPVFREVNLGLHEERLRRALFEEDPMEPSDYPFITAALFFKGENRRDYIVPPSLIKLDGFHVYRCVIAGFLYSFFVGSHKLDEKIENLILKKDGVIQLPISHAEDLPFLRQHFGEIGAVIRRNAESNRW